MIILGNILISKEQYSVQVELPRANMVIDPRPIETSDEAMLPFRCEYHENGTTITLTKNDDQYYNKKGYSFRVYDPATETVPSFDSTIYTYFGLDGETAPLNTTVLIIHPSVTVIVNHSFYMEPYETIEKCFMHDGVHTIGENAFRQLKNMKMIRLSRSLTTIDEGAFLDCWSLEAVFLPPSVKEIHEVAFGGCDNLRIFPLPMNIDISEEEIRDSILGGCDNFFQTTQIQPYGEDDDERVHQEIIDFYRDQVPPLHKVCLDTYVTRQSIQQCVNTHGRATASVTDHDGMTPLHILAMNPHADASALLACFDLNKSSALVGDSRGNTPLDYLRVHHDSIEDHTLLVYKLCEHRDAATRSRSSQDNQETSTKRQRVN